MTIPVSALPRLHAAITAAGVAIAAIDINGIVTPQNLQTAAQPTIDAFNTSVAADATYLAQQEKAAATARVDNGALQVGAKFDRLTVALGAGPTRRN
jgi:hypothetical protein